MNKERIGQLNKIDGASALGWYNFAHSYWASAVALEIAELKVTHPDGPVNFAYYHAIELFLKSFLVHKGCAAKDLRRLGHSLTDIAKRAQELGLEMEALDFEVLKLADPNFMPSRYLRVGRFSRPQTIALWGMCSVLFDQVGDILRADQVMLRELERPTNPRFECEAEGE
ncbi:hypothetical protein FIV00_15195 [Labrenzia sp. THAF82]|uniref:hypothetical protein n=1 Tax=Labrenzia sp. THAF82 TaxID=2587861 RepID=UPI0012678617|nr:hypothetical protein [Labrenzia sp. THAF82]QFT31837.1 hypothetical protein FIV00_15195 [Labrenzia sp. THAF82]